MATKDFHMQVRFIHDDPTKFEAAVGVMKNEAKRTYALLRTLAGPGQPAPEIKIFSNDFLEGITEESQAGAAGAEKVSTKDENADGDV
jgi:hypothetical protein